jgi:CO dehydrogenase/acetyl-CoA synthase alpha subunit
MDADIYALVAKYGFKNLHIRLEEIMRDEYAYFQTKFQVPVVIPNTIIVSEVQEKKQRKTKVKKAQLVEPIEQSEDVQLSLENTELKDVIVTVTEKTNNFRDPKEMKEFQKNAVEAKRKENEAAGLSPADFLTKENLRQWIEEEGKTYAWVAREKAGCPETQVAAQAQMMGLKSRISKKLGRVMTGR